MSTSPNDANESGSRPDVRREIRWDAVAAIIASLIGLLALIVAGYTAYIQRYTAQLQREQLQAQVWPRLSIGGGNWGGPYELSAYNAGVGSAIIQDVQILVAGKPVTDWPMLWQRLGLNAASLGPQSVLNNTVVRAGGRLSWVTFHNQADFKAFQAAWVRFRVEARVCYSSTLGDNWLLVFHMREVPIPHPVPSCPNWPHKDQFDG